MSGIFDIKVSFYSGVTCVNPTDVVLRDMLFGNEYRENVLYERLLKANKGDEAYKAAKMRLPLFTPSGMFSSSKADSLIRHSGFICIDIDGKDNPDLDDFDEVKELISQVPYIAYCGRSVGGHGYFALIRISDPSQHQRHFNSLKEDFARCGLVIDKACKDVSRKRFVSFDSSPYVNECALIYKRLTNERQQPMPKIQQLSGTGRSKDVSDLVEAIKRTGTDITGGYDQWFRIGCALATEFGESGRNLFHAISEQGVSYNYRQCDSKYSDCLRAGGNIGIGTLFYYAKNYGL